MVMTQYLLIIAAFAALFYRFIALLSHPFLEKATEPKPGGKWVVC
jgi:hypothetical protein